MNLEALQLHTPSPQRRYVPRGEFTCHSLDRLHQLIRFTFRCLSSYQYADAHKGWRFMPLSRIEQFIANNTAHVERLFKGDFRHRRDNGSRHSEPCAECKTVIETGYHLRALEVAAQVLAFEQAQVAAQLANTSTPASGTNCEAPRGIVIEEVTE